MKFAHIAINCNDPVAVERFYTKYFGFERARVIPVEDWELVFIKAGNVYLELFKTKDLRPIAPPDKDGYLAPGIRHIAFKVDNVDQQLEQMGKDAMIKLGPLSFDDVIPGWKTVWVADPEGNIVEISQGFVDQPNPPTLD